MLLPVCLSGCDGIFDAHPYDMNLKGERDINATNLRKITTQFKDHDTIRVAFISDTHGWYTPLEAAINDINGRNNVDFVIHCGDLTDSGTTLEYQQARKYLSRLRKPYLALIGNHDFLGTGAEGFKWMFGKIDFSFIIGDIKFLCINTNAMEYDHMAAVPDLHYMEREAKDTTERFRRTVVVMHAPPFSDQFNNNVSTAFKYYLHLFPGLMFCVYGHNHNAAETDIYGDGLMFYGIDSAAHRNYRIFTITPEGYEQQQIYY